jgi:hypothetical protein
MIVHEAMGSFHGFFVLEGFLKGGRSGEMLSWQAEP